MLNSIFIGLTALASITGFSSGTEFAVTTTTNFALGDRNKGRISIKDLEIMHV